MNEQKEGQKAGQTKPLPPIKDYDVAKRTYTLRVFFNFFAPFGLIGALLYFAMDVPWYFAPLLSLFATCLVLLFFHFLFKAADYATGRVSTRGLREQLSGDIDRIKYLVRSQKYDDAFKIVNSVLEQDPDFPEALFLKGQILWEAFGLKFEAKEVLLSVMKLVSPEDALYQWTVKYRKKIPL